MIPIGLFFARLKPWVGLVLLSRILWGQELSLESALQQARQHHPSLFRAQGRLLQSQGQTQQALTLGQPTLNLQATYLYNNPALSLQVGGASVEAVVSNNWSTVLSLRQVVASFGRLHWSAAAAELEETARQAELRYADELLQEEVKVQFYQVLLAQALVRVGQEAVTARERQLQIAEQRVLQGAAPGYEIRRDRAGLAQSQQDLHQSLEDVRVARAGLERLLGTWVGELQPPTQALTPPPLLPESMPPRQDLLAAQSLLEAGRARLELARVQDAPTLTFQSDYGRRNALGLQPGQLWSTGLVLQIPFSDGGLADAQAQQAEGLLQQLEATVEQCQRDIHFELESQRARLETAWNQLSTSQLAASAAEEAARISRLRYQNGLATHLELLDAEATLTAAQQSFQKSRYHYLQAGARWERIVSR